MDGKIEYHKDTYEVLAREVALARYSHSTDVYLDRMYASVGHYTPNIHALIASLENNIQKRTEEIANYPGDYAYVQECQEYIRRHKEWIARCAEISVKCAQNEAHNNAIMASLEGLR